MATSNESVELTETIEEIDQTESSNTIEEDKKIENQTSTTETTNNQPQNELNRSNDIINDVDASDRDETTNSQETVEVSNTTNQESTNREQDVEMVNIIVSTPNPCVGEQIVLKNSVNKKGDWYVDGKLIQSNTSTLVYSWTSKQSSTVKFVYDSLELTRRINSVALSSELVSTKIKDDTYSFKLSNSDLIANWYVDGKLIATNAKEIKHAFKKVGLHHIKSIPVNHICSAPLETHISVQAKGEIVTYSVFTPNGDGKNDQYEVDILNYESYFIQIFNNRNELVFSSNNPSYSWNGRTHNNGTECPNGEYIVKINYKLTGEDEKIKNIKLTLIRN